MNLDNESYQLLNDSAVEWFAHNASIERFRELRESNDYVSGTMHWSAMAELGWAGLLVGEEHGGVGLGMREMGAILEQAGRNLAPSPLISTGVIAVSILSSCEKNASAKAALANISQGKHVIALGIDEGHHHQPEHVATKVRGEGDNWVINGMKTAVADANNADAFLMAATCEGSGEPCLLLVNRDVLSVQPLNVIDCGDHGNVKCNETVVETDALLAKGSACTDLLTKALDSGRIALAAEMQGNAWAAFEMTVEYLKIREQFGQLIGSYQALQHRAAKMYVELQMAQSAVSAALHAVDGNSEDVPALASLAKAMVGETLKHVTNETIQLHGGIGMTDEHNAGLFLKRARVAEYLYGSSAYHRDRFATLRGF